jgi:magnesium transporter
MRSEEPRHIRKTDFSTGTQAEPFNSNTPALITLISYNETTVEEHALTGADTLQQYIYKDTITWINIDGTEDSESLRKIGELFNLHPLLLEDISVAGQRPKTDEYGDLLFTTVNSLHYDPHNNTITMDQISIVLGPDYVLSFQKAGGDVFEPNRDLIRANKSKIRKHASDYLFYTLIDTIVDNYFIILEKLGETLEDIEDALIVNPTERTLNDLYKVKRDLIALRKTIWPLREVLLKFDRAEFEQISSTTRTYFKDVYDHIVQIIDTLESFRELSGGMLDLYMSSISNKMNAIMKTLTIISTIFIPLSFLAGVYGMNFENMPELKNKNGYYVFVVICVVITVGMLAYFRKKKWL